MDLILVQILAFAAVLLMVLGIQSAMRSSVPHPDVQPGLFGLIAGPAQEIGSWVESWVAAGFPSQIRRIRGFLLAAALQDQLGVRDVLGSQAVLCMVGGMVALIGMFMLTLRADFAIFLALLTGFVGWVYPSLWLARAAASRQQALSRALPYSLDLLTVAMQAGQDFGAAVRILVREGPRGPLSEEFSIMLQETELGKSRMEALQELANRIQLDEVRSVVSAIVQSTEMGSSVTDTLRIQGEEIRRARFHKAERQAARAPSLMMIPVALFILPSVFIVILTPIIMRMKQSIPGSP